MNVLITGASSKIGREFVVRLAARAPKGTVLLLATRDARNAQAKFPELSSAGQWLSLDLSRAESEIRAAIARYKIDTCVHMAAITHSPTKDAYFATNHEGTAKLARALWAGGCRDFVFISSQTAAFGAGAYAESKIRAEQALLEFDWQRLLIIRPSELILSGGKEGIDKFLALAKQVRLMPVFVDWPRIRFSPMDVGVFVDTVASDVLKPASGVALRLIRGPWRTLFDMWMELARTHLCLPVPVPVPLLALAARLLKALGRETLLGEQLQRLKGDRAQLPRPGLELEDVELPFEFGSALKNSSLFSG